MILHSQRVPSAHTDYATVRELPTMPPGRVCLHRRCITRLSIYNLGDYCSVHAFEHADELEPEPLPYKSRLDEAAPGNRICYRGEMCEAGHPEQPLNNVYFAPAVSRLRDGNERVNYRRTCRKCEAADRRRARALMRGTT